MPGNGVFNPRLRPGIPVVAVVLSALLAVSQARALAGWPPALRLADLNLSVEERRHGQPDRVFSIKPGSPFARGLDVLLREDKWGISFDTYAPGINVAGSTHQKSFIVNLQRSIIVVNVEGHFQKTRRIDPEDFARLQKLLAKEPFTIREDKTPDLAEPDW